MNDRVGAAISGSCPTGQAPAGLDAPRGDPGRVELTVWALNTVNDMVSLDIIPNTVEARSRHLNALLDVLLPDEETPNGNQA